MYSTYRLNANELNNEFLEGLKKIFKDKEIEIAVYEVDETDYLMKSDNNKKRLLEAVQNVENSNNLVELNISDL